MSEVRENEIAYSCSPEKVMALVKHISEKFSDVLKSMHPVPLKEEKDLFVKHAQIPICTWKSPSDRPDGCYRLRESKVNQSNKKLVITALDFTGPYKERRKNRKSWEYVFGYSDKKDLQDLVYQIGNRGYQDVDLMYNTLSNISDISFETVRSTFLDTLGFEEIVTVDKERQYLVNDTSRNLKILIDRVNGLDDAFLEMEIITENKKELIDQAFEEIRSIELFLRKSGIDLTESLPYTQQLLEKKGML